MSRSTSFYFQSARQITPYPVLEGTQHCDVCVVGGGFSGVNTALELAERGCSVVLLEAHTIGWGASGRNGGQLIRGLGDRLEKFTAQIGAEGVRELELMGIEALLLVRERIHNHAIACDWQPGFCDVANTPAHYREFAREQAHQASLNYPWPLKLIPKSQLAEVVGSERYCGGLYDPGSGHLQPLDLLQAEARLASQLGVRIFERSVVSEFSESGPLELITPKGRVRAEKIVLCANAHVHDLNRKLARQILPATSHVVVTEVLSPDEAARALPDNCAICDQRIALDYFRLTADRRLLFGGMCHYSGRQPSRISALMRPRIQRVFPWLAHRRVDQAWSGMIGIGANRLPQLGRLSPDIYFAQAYAGHGLNVSHLAARLLAEHLCEESRRLELFEKISHPVFPGGPRLAPWLLALGMAWHQLRERWQV